MSEMKSDSSLPPFEPEDMSEIKRNALLARNAVLLYFAAGLVAAFVTPGNILEHAWAQGFVSFMSFIPYVEKVGQSSFAHPIAPFFAAMMCALSLAIIRPMWSAAYPFPKEIANRRIRVRQTLKWIGMVIFVAWLVVWVIFDHNFGTRLGRLQISSRAGMGIFGTITMAGVPFFSMAVIHCIKNWRHILYSDMDELIKLLQKFTKS